MFTTLVIIVHVIVSVIMVLFILLQSGKGADIGAVFGGGSSQTVFGSTGATPFLSKVTIGAAVTFMITSIVLSYFSGQAVPVAQSIMDEQPVKEAPVTPGAPGTKETPAPAKSDQAPAPNAEQAPAASTSSPTAPAPAKEAPSAPAQPAAPAATTPPPSGSSSPAPPADGSGTK